jgi:hypothetical protein
VARRDFSPPPVTWGRSLQAKPADGTLPRGYFAPPAPFVGQRRPSGAQPKPDVAAQKGFSPRVSRLLVTTVQCADVKTSKFASTNANQSGQIYGIWKNEQYPNKINEGTSLTKAKCLYVGKTARGEDLGTRFIEHVKNDTSCPWSLAKGCDYDEHDHTIWPYVVRNLWSFADITELDVAAAEQYYIQDHIEAGAKLLNDKNAISPDKFKAFKGSSAFTTKGDYPKDWKPKDFKSM